MKSLAYLSIIWAVILLLLAAFDEQRGIASVIPPTGGRFAEREVVKKNEHPETFQNLMTYQWLRDGLALIAGFILLGMSKRADRTDPFSPDFAGRSELDELGRSLDDEKKRRERL